MAKSLVVVESPAEAKAKAKGKPKAKATPEPHPEIHRVLFHEITRKGITQGMENPSPLDRSRFDSRQARRIPDRLVGYTLSPLLWTKVRRGVTG